MNITCGESLNNAVDLLSLARKPHVHEQLSDCNIDRVPDEVEAFDVRAERPSVKLVRATQGA